MDIFCAVVGFLMLLSIKVKRSNEKKEFKEQLLEFLIYFVWVSGAILLLILPSILKLICR